MLRIFAFYARRGGVTYRVLSTFRTSRSTQSVTALAHSRFIPVSPHLLIPPNLSPAPASALFSFFLATSAAVAVSTSTVFSPAECDGVHSAQPLSNHSEIASSPALFDSDLLQRVSRADPQAVHTLSDLVFTDSMDTVSSSESLVSALTDALSASVHVPSSEAILMAVLRMLAHLSQQVPSCPQFSEARLYRVLSDIILSLVKVSSEPWLHWIHRHLTSSSSTSSLTVPPSATFHTQGSQTYSHLSSDHIDAAIASHALTIVANLSRYSHLHQSLLQSPILLHLCRLIWQLHYYPAFFHSSVPHDYLEIVRSTTVAVSALAKSAPQQLISSFAYKPLLQFMFQNDHREIQMYAAGGIRNLTRHPAQTDLPNAWAVHRQLVVSGVADSLSSCMDAGALSQARAFSAFAFVDLMTTQHPKAPLIWERLRSVFEPFACLLKDDTSLVSRAMYRSLISLFDRMTDLPQTHALPESLLTSISNHCGPLIRAAFKRHDITAVRAIRSMCSNEMIAQRLIEKGAIEHLGIEMKQARGSFWNECTAVLAQLSEWAPLRRLIAQRGVLISVLARPCLENDGLWAATFLANMSRDEDFHVQVGHGGLRVLLSAITSKEDKVVREGARGLYNLTLGGVSKVMVGQGGTLLPLVKAVSNSGQTTRRFAIGALAELSEAPDLAIKLIEADVVAAMLQSVQQDESVKRDVARCFAQLSQVSEVHGSLVKHGAADWLATMVSNNGGRGSDSGEVMHFATIAVCNIASSPGIARNALLERGMDRTLTALASSGMSASLVIHNARQALGNLRGSQKVAAWSTDGISRKGSPA